MPMRIVGLKHDRMVISPIEKCCFKIWYAFNSNDSFSKIVSINKIFFISVYWLMRYENMYMDRSQEKIYLLLREKNSCVETSPHRKLRRKLCGNILFLFRCVRILQGTTIHEDDACVKVKH